MFMAMIIRKFSENIKIMELNDTKINKPMGGIGVMILKDGKVLLSKRKGSHGAGEYAFPGGHLEYMESFEDCALREVKEECGIGISNLRFEFVANLLSYAPKHYVHIGLIADWFSGEPMVLEPERSESWGWYDLDKLPETLFATTLLGVESYKEQNNYYDS
jgi:8-oxo-dGTP diphosphatase